jgi:hypothetical protein
MYDYINYVLGTYFSMNAELTEAEAVSSLKESASQNEELFDGLRSELESAFSDENFSWKSIMEEYDVVFINDEGAARSYAKKVLWDTLYLPGGDIEEDNGGE